jgi:hypothetical protein
MLIYFYSWCVHMTHCLYNSRNISNSICFDGSIKISSKNYNDGFRITATTIGFKNREEKKIRLVNEYIFGKRKITAIWTNTIRLTYIESSKNMSMRPYLSGLWLSVDNEQINSSIPSDMITKFKNEVNTLIGPSRSIMITDIDLDQFEMLFNNKIIISSDFLLEKLLIYIDTHEIASSDVVTFSRKIPDDILLTITEEKNK